jgi:hypothetical protein
MNQEQKQNFFDKTAQRFDQDSLYFRAKASVAGALLSSTATLTLYSFGFNKCALASAAACAVSGGLSAMFFNKAQSKSRDTIYQPSFRSIQKARRALDYKLQIGAPL